MTEYRGKPLPSYSTEQLQLILKSMADQLDARRIASLHNKFTRTDGKALVFPEPNPNFLNLMNEIETELNNRKDNA